jgi:hypothetical protein
MAFLNTRDAVEHDQSAETQVEGEIREFVRHDVATSRRREGAPQQRRIWIALVKLDRLLCCLHAFTAIGSRLFAPSISLELSPSFALGHLVLGLARLFSGKATEAIAPLEHGVRLSPFDPHNFVWYQFGSSLIASRNSWRARKCVSRMA